MLLDQLCVQCGATQFRRSRFQSPGERILSTVILPYRCVTCGWRQSKFRFVDISLSEVVETQMLEAPHGGDRPA